MTATSVSRPAEPALRAALQLAVLFAVARLLFQFALTLYSTHIGYSYFRDEFYYIACGRHLAWGYVDHGPIVALQARLGQLLFGDSVFALRVFPAFAGALTVALTGILAWRFGGRRSAQFLAMLCVFLAPEWIALDGFLSMNCWEPVFWMTALFALLNLQCTSESRPDPRLWTVVLGLSAGIGLLNKPSMLFFLVALGIGLLCTPQRRVLLTRWMALGIALMVLIALPNVLWQLHHHWPTLEFLRDGQQRGKNIVLTPFAFLAAQVMMLHPVNALVWVPGLVSLIRARTVTNTRWLGIAYLVFLPLMWSQHAKDYYLAPFYPALFAAGAVAWEHRFRNSRAVAENRLIAFPVFEPVAAALMLLALPMASPVLRPAAWVRYADAMHTRPAQTETGAASILPQFYADRFGWNEIVTKVTAAYRALPPADRAQACIAVSNYGEAGAIDFFNRRDHLGLPPATSGHNNYWLWGDHGCTRRVVIAVTRETPADFRGVYQSVQLLGHVTDPYAVPLEQHSNILLLRNRNSPLRWIDEKNYI